MSYSSSGHQFHEQALKLTIAVYRVTDYFPKAEVLRNHLRIKANEIFERLTEQEASTADVDGDVDSLVRKIHTIKGYLAIAHTLNYVRPVNFTILEREYALIERILEAERADARRERTREGEADLGPTQSSVLSAKNPSTDGRESLGTDSTPTTGDRDQKCMDSDDKRTTETLISEKRFSEKDGESLRERHVIILNYFKKSGSAKISDLYGFFHGLSSKTIQRDLQYLVDRNILRKEGEKRWTVYSLIGG